MQMRISRCKLFALVSMLIISTGLMSAAVNAVAVPNRKTAAYISVAPKLIGLGQELTVNIWVYPAPAGPTFYGQTIPRAGFEDLTVTFTRPDGSKDTFMPTDPSVGEHGLTDAVGSLYFFYKPNQVGTWSAIF